MIYYAIKENTVLNQMAEDKEFLIESLNANGFTDYEILETELDILNDSEKYIFDFDKKEWINNPNYEQEQAEERKQEFLKQFFKIDGYGYFRKQPKGYGSAVESLNTAFNIVTVIGNLPANTLTFYAEPDFLIPEQCTEEWLVENAIKNEVMTPSEFGTFYAQFMMAWNTQEHQ